MSHNWYLQVNQMINQKLLIQETFKSKKVHSKASRKFLNFQNLKKPYKVIS